MNIIIIKKSKMKTGIIGILNNPATSENSHSSGMVNIVAKLFNADVLKEHDNWDLFDQLIIYHGVNFRPGKFNIIGGINNEVLLRAEKLNNYKGNVYSLDGFQLNDFSKIRKINLYDNAENIPFIELPKRKNLVIGDSHSLSVWPNENYEISRNDGKTLFGFLKLNVDLSNYDAKVWEYLQPGDLFWNVAGNLKSSLNKSSINSFRNWNNEKF